MCNGFVLHIPRPGEWVGVKKWLSVILVVPWLVFAAPGDHPVQTPFRDFLVSGEPCTFCPEMITIPSGRFLMGSLPGNGHDDEHGPEGLPIPAYISSGLSFSISEVTRGEFAAYVEANPERQVPTCSGLVDGSFRRHAGTGWQDPGFLQSDKHPVVCVTWEMARAYTEWLSKLTGQHYRLPSEAEWEYAARAQSRYRFWWGDAMLPNRVNCLHEWCDKHFPHTAPVRSYRSNLFGLHDMPGNVWEWTADCYQADAYKNHNRYPAPVTGPDNCKRVIRGGSWAENYWSLRSANREGWKSDTPLNDIGFRVVRVGGRLPL